jgi:hypothetical protein
LGALASAASARSVQHGSQPRQARCFALGRRRRLLRWRWFPLGCRCLAGETRGLIEQVLHLVDFPLALWPSGWSGVGHTFDWVHDAAFLW